MRQRGSAVIKGSYASSKGILFSVCMVLAAVLVIVAVVDDARAAQTTVQAETMTLSGSLVNVRDNTAASGGKEVAFFTNGSASSSFEGAATEITLRGRGTACQGNPRLKVYVDGALKGTVNLTSGTFANYTLALSGLSAGTHTLRVSFENDFYAWPTCDRNAYLDSYALTLPSTTPTTCNKGSFLAEYRNEFRTFNTQPTLSRCEGTINNDWGSGSPAPSVNPDSFTARWVGTFDFEASDYEFTATADDGVRLWVDGQLLIDRWQDQPATTYKATKTMSAGTHEIKVEYYEYGGAAVAKTSWAKATSTPPPPPPPSTDNRMHGAFVGGAPTASSIDSFATLTGEQPEMVMWYINWDGYLIDSTQLNTVASRGAIPNITWEPFGRDPQAIANGQYDSYIRSQAQVVRNFGKPIMLRPFHEFNGDWYSWSIGAGNSPAELAAAYRHVVDVFNSEGATNAMWLWSPNVDLNLSLLDDAYPGDAYVDYVALDGYNWGPTQGWSSWQSCTGVFKRTYDSIAAWNTTDPMMVGESASTEIGGDKGAWIRSCYNTEIPQDMPRIKGFVWFHTNKEQDWRVNSGANSLNAYKQVVADPSWRGTMP